MERHIATVNVAPYDIFITDRRLVMINLGGGSSASTAGSVVGGVAGALIGSGIDMLRDSNKKEKFANLTVDEILALDSKSYAIPHEQITKIKLVKFTRWDRNLYITHAPNSASETKKFKLSGEQYDRFKTVLPTVGALSEKFEVKD